MLEIEQARINLESNHLNLVGIKNSLKPTLQVFAELTNNGLTGSPDVLGLAAGTPPPCGHFRRRLRQPAGRRSSARNYPNYSAGISLNIPLRNRAAQADYATSLLEIRQNELNYQKQINQVRVDVQNAVIGIQQARARYDAAVQARMLSQADIRSRPEQVRTRRRYAVSGGAGPARSVRGAEFGSAGDGQLQPRPHRPRSGARAHAGCESHFDG